MFLVKRVQFGKTFYAKVLVGMYKAVNLLIKFADGRFFVVSLSCKLCKKGH